MTKGNSLVSQNTYRGTSKTNSASWAIFSSGTLAKKIRVVVFNNCLFIYRIIHRRMLTIYYHKRAYTFVQLTRINELLIMK